MKGRGDNDGGRGFGGQEEQPKTKIVGGGGDDKSVGGGRGQGEHDGGLSG